MGIIRATWVKTEVTEWIADKSSNMDTQIGYLVQNILNIYAAVAEVLAPYRSGFLRDSFVVTQSGLEGVLYNTAEYFIFVIFGTRPHPIEPVNGLALYWPGAWYPVRRVWHPGTQANDFLADVIPSSEAGVDSEVDKVLSWLAA